MIFFFLDGDHATLEGFNDVATDLLHRFWESLTTTRTTTTLKELLAAEVPLNARGNRCRDVEKLIQLKGAAFVG